MDIKKWFEDVVSSDIKKALPILSFPGVSLAGITVGELISDSDMQAKVIKAVADRCNTLASVSLMDLSLEAEAFGSEIRVEDDEVPTVTNVIVRNMDDANALTVPKVGAGRTGIYLEAIDKACDLIKDRPVFAGAIGPYSLAGRLTEMTDFFIMAKKQPELVHTLLEKTTEFLIEYYNAYKNTGASGVMMAEPTAGLLSPKLIAEFSTPYVKRIIDTVQTDEFAVIYHNCGKTVPLLDSIKTVGAMGYHFGNTIDLSEMLEKASEDMIIMGNVDPAGQFASGTPESIYKATTELLVKCSIHPNFIPSSGCDIPPQSPWPNIDSFFKAVDDFYSKE